MRGTISRAELRQIIAATYHQAWWPSTDHVRFDGDRMPVWHQPSGRYLDPVTWELLTDWDDALDALGPHEEPAACGPVRGQFDARRACGSKDSARCVGYLTRVPDQTARRLPPPRDGRATDHVDRLAKALRYEPCSPTCANWLRYGIQPKSPRPGLVPGACKGKAHRRDHLGYAGRRVLVSRKWSGKTLADHRGDRKPG
jgi:hypothetical protein